jgi:hypothetical protein
MESGGQFDRIFHLPRNLEKRVLAEDFNKNRLSKKFIQPILFLMLESINKI